MHTFYAELLPNIRSISLLISLDTPAAASTRVTVNPGASSASLHHHGESINLPLPAAANLRPHQLMIPFAAGEKKLSCRLPLASESPARNNSRENYAPWSAPELMSKASVAFLCRECGVEILPSGRRTKWKDLPSGNWADMMDFWHCHKPHDDKKSADGEGSRYSVLGQGFVVEQGIGLVDRGYFLLAAKDCTNCRVSHCSLSLMITLNSVCTSCDAPLGAIEAGVGTNDMQMWRINKWTLRLNDQGKEIAYSLECFLASQFIAFTEEGGVRRLFITMEDNRSPGLKLWIFNTEVYYTHSSSPMPVRGIKVFWQEAKPGEKVQTDSLKVTGLEAVELDEKAFHTLASCLEESNQALPADIGKNGEWNAGSLRRFEE
ncbi:ubiquitin-conjugating enzyme E2-binding protein [Sphaerosporella brunnea]|uniref:Ubiquitin-conjugating enzyme E2-binding protein n=1 Tax=Sphaerosporella brunnea TaxID=1250544 RepID=A0A5J5EFW3_9PEZI|nr:ubiquitin-conjugating enzyme E2-binding protein [Sphaerosporella brunnea]